MADEIASTLQRWSTEDVPARQRFEYYTDEFCKIVGTPMRIASANPEVFFSDNCASQLRMTLAVRAAPASDAPALAASRRASGGPLPGWA